MANGEAGGDKKFHIEGVSSVGYESAVLTNAGCTSAPFGQAEQNLQGATAYHQGRSTASTDARRNRSEVILSDSPHDRPWSTLRAPPVSETKFADLSIVHTYAETYGTLFSEAYQHPTIVAEMEFSQYG